MLYPGMPGHDIVGRVLKAGKGVTRHKVGDLVSVDRSFDRPRTVGALLDRSATTPPDCESN